MKQYCVYADEKWCRRIDIWAKDEQEAKEKANKVANDNCRAIFEQDVPPQAYFEGIEVVTEWVEEWDENEQGVWAGGEK